MTQTVVLVVLTGAVSAQVDDQAVPAQLKRLQGTWAPIENVIDGVPTPKEALEPWRTIIKGSRYENQHKGEPDTTGPMKVVAEKEGTLHLDLLPTNGPGKGKTVKCILKFVSEDEFRLCMPAEPDGPRPEEFSSKKGSLKIMRTYKRVKE